MVIIPVRTGYIGQQKALDSADLPKSAADLYPDIKVSELEVPSPAGHPRIVSQKLSAALPFATRAATIALRVPHRLLYTVAGACSGSLKARARIKIGPFVVKLRMMPTRQFASRAAAATEDVAYVVS